MYNNLQLFFSIILLNALTISSRFSELQGVQYNGHSRPRLFYELQVVFYICQKMNQLLRTLNEKTTNFYICHQTCFIHLFLKWLRKMYIIHYLNFYLVTYTFIRFIFNIVRKDTSIIYKDEILYVLKYFELAKYFRDKNKLSSYHF